LLIRVIALVISVPAVLAGISYFLVAGTEAEV
jgi:hypothetical protein